MQASYFASAIAAGQTPRSKYAQTNHKAQHSSHVTHKKLSYQEIAKKLHWASDKTTCNVCNGYYKEPKSILTHPHPLPITQQSTRITAKGPTLFSEQGWSLLRDDVVVTQPGRVIKADKAYLYRDDKTGKITRIKLIGHVRMEEYGKLIVAHTASMNLQKSTMTFHQVVYHLSEKTMAGSKNNKKLQYDAWGLAKRAYRTSTGVLQLWDATYTTCSPLDPAWQLFASYMKLDKQAGRGTAKNIVIKLKKLPVFYVPRFSFPLDQRRKTGFLGFTGGYSSKRGPDVSNPFYWNMAPNYDATITPRYMSKRGVQLDTLFRYLTVHHSGFVYFSFLPNDREFNSFKKDTINQYSGPGTLGIYVPYVNALRKESNNRGFIAIKNSSHFNENWSSDLDINVVSGPYYFRDFGFTFGTIHANQLLNQFDLRYMGSHWNMALLLQTFQTLHLISQINNPVTNQYSRYPELDINGDYPNVFSGFNFQLTAQAVNFLYHSDFPIFTFQRPIGQRVHLRPSISRPIYFASGFLIPKISLDSTTYYAKRQTLSAGINRPTFNGNRNLPLFNIDSGLYFDRHAHINDHPYTITLEPRLFYLYVPFLNQQKYPVFDTQLLPFSALQLFSLNRFSGYDRLENANQVTLGLTSRIIDGKTGVQKLKAELGFIYYFTHPRVMFPYPNKPNPQITPMTNRLSPIVAELSYYPLPYWSATGSLAWDTHRNEMNNAGVQISYSKDARFIASLSYEFVRDIDGISVNINDLNNITHLISAGIAWPINQRWSTLAYWYYNIADKRSESYYLGLQYSTCCWALRFVASRHFTGAVPISKTSTQTKNEYRTTFYVQLMLKGLGSYGNSDPSHLLTSTLPGFVDPFK